MTAKQYVMDSVRKMPDDVTLDEVVRWVTVMDMIGVGNNAQEELCRDLCTELEKDMQDYFQHSAAERKRRSTRNARKKRSAGAA